MERNKKSQTPSNMALAYVLQRQWMNYTTNRTVHQYNPSTARKWKMDITIKTVHNP